MAKFNMKDYEDYMKEEERQNRLQEALESQRKEETSEADEFWRDYQREQEEEIRREEDADSNYYDYLDPWACWWDYGYDLDDMDTAYDPYDDLLFVDDPDEYDGYFDEDDSDENDLIDDLLDLDGSELEGMSATIERISRKAVARNRHLNEIKAKKRAQQSAAILESKYHTSTVRTDYEEFRLYSRSSAATKKVARVKTA